MSRCATIVAARRKFEVRLTDEEAAAARTLLSQLIEGAAGALPLEAKLPDLACRIHSSRHERRRFFPDELFADPAWDMILALYCAESRGERLSVTSLGYSVGLPQATAARWISQLRKSGLIDQQQDEHDGRRKFLRLSSVAEEKVTAWLERVEGLLEPRTQTDATSWPPL